MNKLAWCSTDLELDKAMGQKTAIADWFNNEYHICKLSLSNLARERGIKLSHYDVRMMQDKWDLKFIVVAQEEE